MTSRFQRRFQRVALMALAAAAVVGSLSACVPLVVGGAVVGTLVVIDRRTSGTQLEDEGIEFRASNRIKEVIGDKGHVNVTSYNRQVLLTGEVPTAKDRELVEKAVAGVDNVRSVVNELAVMPNSTLTQRSNDTLITGKVKASFVDAKDISLNAFKIVTERNTVFLMGRVTPREVARATEIARGVGGVEKVVRVFEIISEDELARYQAKPAPVTTDSSPQK
ncbi:MAG: BON domain-containing protein [Xylophilus sp.]|nr:BON domain-containing protein [Burkholderiaceae bacterium]MBP6652406.1 BON domain-containing protein [Xylophilus sp.]MBP8151398.1 BON domain-containing protein [Xylophilus sp.]MBP8229037.1 BON domain-containing protein [Xylophilus sp.]